MADRHKRRQWLATVGIERMRRLHEIAGTDGRPWWQKRATALDELAVVGSDWYRRY